MSRIIWSVAGLSMALGSLVDAAEGPKAPFDWVDGTAWSIVFGLATLGWLWLALDAARGRFE